MKEHALIDLIRGKCPSNASVILGIDDDAAVIRPTKENALVCTDMLMDGVHFLVDKASPEAIGHKALAVNLSDIAAMGGKALSAYVSIALPRALADKPWIERFYEGMGKLAQRFDVAIAGGDTNIWDGPLVVNVTVIGECHARGAVLRSGAQAGDWIFVTGPLGGSLEGHHLDFQPRLDEARALLDHFVLNSMMDVSDGLAKDLREISRQSGVSIYLDPLRIPLRAGILPHPQRLEKALCDGEDFELAFTLSPAEGQKLERNPAFGYCQRIGEIRSGQGLFWMNDGHEILWQGYQHGARP